MGAALDVPGKCVTQPSPMLVTVTCREKETTFTTPHSCRCKISTLSENTGACELFFPAPSLKHFSVGGFGKEFSFAANQAS